MIAKYVILVEMLTLSELWTKNDFFIRIAKNVLVLKMLIFSKIWTKMIFTKKHPFGRNIDIKLVIVKKTIVFIVIAKKGPYMAKKTTKTIFSQKKVITKKRPFGRNVDIKRVMDKKRFFIVIAKKRFFLEMLIFSEIWTKTIFSK